MNLYNIKKKGVVISSSIFIQVKYKWKNNKDLVFLLWIEIRQVVSFFSEKIKSFENNIFLNKKTYYFWFPKSQNQLINQNLSSWKHVSCA